MVAQVESRTFISENSVIGVQFASQQSPPRQRVPDDHFMDATLAAYNWNDDERWHRVGDAIISYDANAHLTTVNRNAAAHVITQQPGGPIINLPIHPVFKSSVAEIDAGDGSYTNDFGGIESPSIVVSPAGTAWGAARFTALVDLDNPIVLEMLGQSAGDWVVVAKKEFTPRIGETIEDWVGYVIGSGGVDEDTELRVRLVQYVGPSQDAWRVDALGIFDDTITWEFSNDGGDTWFMAHGIRNNPYGVMKFPLLGQALRYRITSYERGTSISAVELRPWYADALIARREMPQRFGPNLSSFDQEPSITDDPEFKTWPKPIPRDWFRQARLFPYLTESDDDFEGTPQDDLYAADYAPAADVATREVVLTRLIGDSFEITDEADALVFLARSTFDVVSGTFFPGDDVFPGDDLFPGEGDGWADVATWPLYLSPNQGLVMGGTVVTIRSFEGGFDGGNDYATLVSDDSPFLYWRLGDAGPDVVDASGNGRGGHTEIGTPGFGATGLLSGDVDTAVSFDISEATSELIASDDDISLTGQAALEVIVKATAMQLGDNFICGLGGKFGIHLERVGADLTIHGEYTPDDGFTVIETAPVVITVGAQYHVGLDLDGTTMRLYLDGAVAASVAMVGDLQATFQWFGVGGGNVASVVLDEVALYDASLSAGTWLEHAEAVTGNAVFGVQFGETPAVSYLVLDDHTIEAVAPAGTVDTEVDVQVELLDGLTEPSVTGKYAYVAAPVITDFSWGEGGSTIGFVGGDDDTVITLTGTNFFRAQHVFFTFHAVDYECEFEVIDSTTIEFTMPAVDDPTLLTESTFIYVSNAAGTAPAVFGINSFLAIGRPTITSLTPTSGSPAGSFTSPIVVTGTNFFNVDSVLFGDIPAIGWSIIDATHLEVPIPATLELGQVDVRIANGSGTSAVVAGDHYTYVADGDFDEPTITDISPASVASDGSDGTVVVSITGTAFTGDGDQAVFVGDTRVFDITFVSDTSLTFEVPYITADGGAFEPGAYDVRVVTAGGISPVTTADELAYT